MYPIGAEVEHLELIVETGKKLRLRGRARSCHNRGTRLLDGYQVLRMRGVFQDFLQAIRFGLQEDPVSSSAAAESLSLSRLLPVSGFG